MSCFTILRIFWPIAMGILTVIKRVDKSKLITEVPPGKILIDNRTKNLVLAGMIVFGEIVYILMFIFVACKFYRRKTKKDRMNEILH